MSAQIDRLDKNKDGKLSEVEFGSQWLTLVLTFKSMQPRALVWHSPYNARGSRYVRYGRDGTYPKNVISDADAKNGQPLEAVAHSTVTSDYLENLDLQWRFDEWNLFSSWSER